MKAIKVSRIGRWRERWNGFQNLHVSIHHTPKSLMKLISPSTAISSLHRSDQSSNWEGEIIYHEIRLSNCYSLARCRFILTSSITRNLFSAARESSKENFFFLLKRSVILPFKRSSISLHFFFYSQWQFFIRVRWVINWCDLRTLQNDPSFLQLIESKFAQYSTGKGF